MGGEGRPCVRSITQVEPAPGTTFSAVDDAYHRPGRLPGPAGPRAEHTDWVSWRSCRSHAPAATNERTRAASRRALLGNRDIPQTRLPTCPTPSSAGSCAPSWGPGETGSGGIAASAAARVDAGSSPGAQPGERRAFGFRHTPGSPAMSHRRSSPAAPAGQGRFTQAPYFRVGSGAGTICRSVSQPSRAGAGRGWQIRKP